MVRWAKAEQGWDPAAAWKLPTKLRSQALAAKHNHPACHLPPPACYPTRPALLLTHQSRASWGWRRAGA